MSLAFKKFSTQVAPERLKAAQDLAKKEGRQFPTRPSRDLIEKHQHGRLQPEFMGAYFASVEKYGPLYKILAE